MRNVEYKKEVLWPLLSASAILIIAIAGLFYVAYGLVRDDARKVKIDALRYDLLQLENTIVDAETGQRGFLLTGNVTFLAPYEQAIIDNEVFTRKIKKKLSAFSELQSAFANIEKLSTLKFEIIRTSIQVQFNAGAYASHLTLTKDKGRVVMDELNNAFLNIDRTLEIERQTIEIQTKKSYKKILIGALLLLVVIIGMLIFIYHRTLSLFEAGVHARAIAIRTRYDADHDALTKLPNRRHFEYQLNDVVNKALIEKGWCALLYLDLDGFKIVNDTNGHNMGDQALVAVAARFERLLRKVDFIARLGGDEFAIIIQQFQGNSELSKLADRLIKSLRPAIIIDKTKMQLGVSIGIAVFPYNATTKETLLSAADEAMYIAKKAGKNCYAFSASVV